MCLYLYVDIDPTLSIYYLNNGLSKMHNQANILIYRPTGLLNRWRPGMSLDEVKSLILEVVPDRYDQIDLMLDKILQPDQTKHVCLFSYPHKMTIRIDDKWSLEVRPGEIIFLEQTDKHQLEFQTNINGNIYQMYYRRKVLINLKKK